MADREDPAFIQCGRRGSAEEIEQIRETVELFPLLSLKELVATICEHLGWLGRVRITAERRRSSS